KSANIFGMQTCSELRVNSDCSLKTSTKEAEARFIEAMEAAHKQRAKSFELRAASSIARLWCNQGKQNEARKLLGPIFGWFKEGFDTLDLKQAKTLLDFLTA